MKKYGLDLSGKVALVTGGARGIGLGCIKSLTKYGAKVIVNDIDFPVDLIMPDGVVKFVNADVSNASGRENLVRAALGGGSIDTFVSNPVSSYQSPVLNFETTNFERVINDALTSHFEMAKLVANDMVMKRSGKIIFISSVYGSLNRAGSVAYDSAKAGINQMMRVFARELAPYGINVNAVAPGATDTPGERKFATEEELKKSWSKLPFGRPAKPEEIGDVVAFLSSDMADYITGHVLVVDGGMSLCDFSYGLKEK